MIAIGGMDMIIDGVVEQGKHLGRTLGFPTANVRPIEAAGDWPRNGVYIAAIWLNGARRAWLCMLNQGVHPTVPEGKPTIEAHVLGYEGDVYGLPVRVEYLSFLRPERKFDSVEALRAQLSKDRAATAAWLEEALTAGDPDGAQSRARAIEWETGAR